MINVSSLKSSVQYWLLLVPQVFRVNNGSFWNIEGIFQLTPVLEWRRVDQTSRQKGKWMVHLIRNGYDCLVLHHLLIPTPTPPSWHWLQERKAHFIIHLMERGSLKWKKTIKRRVTLPWGRPLAVSQGKTRGTYSPPVTTVKYWQKNGDIVWIWLIGQEPLPCYQMSPDQ